MIYIYKLYYIQQVFPANTRSLGATVSGNPFGIGGAAPFDSRCDKRALVPPLWGIRQGWSPCVTPHAHVHGVALDNLYIDYIYISIYWIAVIFQPCRNPPKSLKHLPHIVQATTAVTCETPCSSTSSMGHAFAGSAARWRQYAASVAASLKRRSNVKPGPWRLWKYWTLQTYHEELGVGVQWKYI